jgi:hypothetical protein
MTSDETTARVAVRDLIDRYHAAINRREWGLLSDLFAADAVWEALSPIDLRFEGHDAVISGLKASVGRQEVLVQSSSGLVIDLNGPDSATVQSTLIEFGRENGSGWSAVGFYADNVVLQGGSWRFVRRTLRVRYMGNAQVGGQVFEAP